MSDKQTQMDSSSLMPHFGLLVLSLLTLLFFPVLTTTNTNYFFYYGVSFAQGTGYISYSGDGIATIWNLLTVVSVLVTSFTSLAAALFKNSLFNKLRVFQGHLVSMLLTLVALLSLFYYTAFVFVVTNVSLQKTIAFYCVSLFLLLIIVSDYWAMRKGLKNSEQKPKTETGNDGFLRRFLALGALCLITGSFFYSAMLLQQNTMNKMTDDSSSSYDRRSGKVRDFQKISDLALAIDVQGSYGLTDDYLWTYTYRLPYFNSVEEIDSVPSHRASQVIFEIDLYRVSQGMASHQKIDLKKLLKDFNKEYKLVSSDSFPYEGELIQSGKDFYLPFEVVGIGLKIKYLYLNLRTLKIEEDVNGERTEQGYDDSLNLEVYSSESFRQHLGALAFDVNANRWLLMKPYQDGEYLQLYQDYPEVLKMAKNGSYYIRPSRVINKSENKEFVHLFDKVEKP